MSCPDCGFVYYVNPSSAVAAFIVNAKDELLVCTRAFEPAKGWLDLPGGFVDYSESAEEAIRREISEELGVEVTTEKYLFSLPNEYLYKGFLVPTLDMFFACKIDDFENLRPSDDVSKAEFVPLNIINPEKFGLQSIKMAVKHFLDVDGLITK
jgi:ADP-ribose pyrophosphatase YjhB (NUDIX family)